ncbi:MAG: major capsid protein, partial [Acidimicrobiales bacterium]
MFTFPLPAGFDFAALSGADLDALETAAREAASPIVAISPADLTEAQVDLLESLGSTVNSVREARTALAEREAAALAEAAARADRVAALASTLAPVVAPAPAPELVTVGAPADAPAAVTAAAPRIGQVAQAQVTLPVDNPAFKRVRPSLAELDFASLVTNPDSDRDYQDWRDVAKFAERRLASYKGMKGSARHTVFSIQRKFDEELLQRGEGDDDDLISHAVDTTRLPGGGLTAAAGWCAPSQVVYDLCELETSDGMIDIPEVQITRGGMRFTPGPDFASIFGGSGYFHQTEAQVIAGTVKPCMEIDCPPFTDIRLEVEGVCITGSILQRRGYPELVERFIRGAMVAHNHRLNAFVIAQMVAGSTAVDLNPPVDVPLDTTATSGLLAAIEMEIEDIRYRNRLGFGAMVEIVLPHWAKAVLRADLSRRFGLAEFEVSDSRIDSWISLRGGRVQYVYDWQDAYSGQATGPGGASPLTAYPNSVFFLAYPAGTWLRGSDDTIRLETIYDSTKLSTNQYTALFTEEGVLVAQVC